MYTDTLVKLIPEPLTQFIPSALASVLNTARMTGCCAGFFNPGARCLRNGGLNVVRSGRVHFKLCGDEARSR